MDTVLVATVWAARERGESWLLNLPKGNFHHCRSETKKAIKRSWVGDGKRLKEQQKADAMEFNQWQKSVFIAVFTFTWSVF